MKYIVAKGSLTDAKMQIKNIGEEIEVSDGDAKVLLEKGFIKKLADKKIIENKKGDK